jgi:biopolymer transport protein TolR
MAMGGFNGGLRGRKVGRYRPMSEINVTPMVDVMLVLLVVFMITAPLLTVGVPVDLPKTKASVIVGEDEPLVVTLDAEGKLILQETEVALDKLVARLTAITENRKETRVFVRGDRTIAYGKVMQVMGRINLAGFNRVALITELPREPARTKK